MLFLARWPITAAYQGGCNETNHILKYYSNAEDARANCRANGHPKEKVLGFCFMQ